MRITDLLKACSVELNGTPQTKEETIKQMVAPVSYTHLTLPTT